MKITVDLSPLEIKKLGELTNANFKDCWCSICHTHDDVAFSIHRLINMITEIEVYDYDDDYDKYDDSDNDNTHIN